MFSRGWHELLARDSGPMHVRLILQPLMATFIAIRSVRRDLREHRRLFAWKFAVDSEDRHYLVVQLRRDVGKLFVVAIMLDVVYQLMVLRWIYPIQSLIVATTLAFVPYMLVRGAASLVVRHQEPRNSSEDSQKRGSDERV